MLKLQKDRKDAITGSLIGFMIGDALGMPAAGIKQEEYMRKFGAITSYRSNPEHPFFFYLKPGQWGSNIRLMLTALESWVESKGYHEDDLKLRLTEVAKRSKEDFIYARWLGETISKALLTGEPANSYSCTCIYRSIPMALLSSSLEEALEVSAQQTRITHISDTSLAASYYLTYILYTLLHTDTDINMVLRQANDAIKQKYNAKILLQRLDMALSDNIKTVEEARTTFGTGSPAIESLPLTTYIIAHHGQDFTQAVLLGANSMRHDSSEETARLAGLSYVVELLTCSGGATDVTAALIGGILGVRVGLSGIPDSLLNELEGKKYIEDTISTLV